jgi:hypothetical protein
MAVMRKRNRLVSFRVSDQEYEALQSSTMMEGARSLSDFARGVLYDVLDSGRKAAAASAATEVATSEEININQTLERLVTTMGELNRVIHRLAILVESTSNKGAAQ